MKHLDVIGYATKLFSLLILITLPIHSSLIAVSVLVFADLITGLLASLKEKKKITSNALRRTVIKTMAYQMAILISFILETYLLSDIPVVKAVTGLIGITEGKSFFENINRLTGIDFWGTLISKLNMPDTKNPPKE